MRPTGAKGEQVRRTDFCSTRTPLALKTLESLIYSSVAYCFKLIITSLIIPINTTPMIAYKSSC
jgi:hypothetical protein